MENIERVVINAETCVGCSLCANDCPSKALRVTDEGVSYIGRCLECGHCVAVCPTNSITMPGLDMAGVAEYNPATFDLKPENLLNSMKFRRSVRFFSKLDIPEAILMQMLEAGRHAPTASNTQKTRFIVVQKDLPAFKDLFWEGMPQIIEQMKAENSPALASFERFYHNYQTKDFDNFFFNAPAMFLIITNNMWDAGLAVANIELMGHAHKIGSLHNGYLKRAIPANPKLMEYLGIGADETLACVMLAGRSGVSYSRTAPRKPAKFEIR